MLLISGQDCVCILVFFPLYDQALIYGVASHE